MALDARDKFLRVQSNRSGSGCQTCKSRRIKCDEGLPRCQRCLKSNRVCQYTSPSGLEASTRFIVYVGHQEPSLFADFSGSEWRAFHHFQHRTALEVTGPFQSELWSNLVLQLAHQHPSVRYSIFALSSMHEVYWRPPNGQNQLQEEAIGYYNKAIRHIVRSPQLEQSSDMLLLSCILFCAIESLRGNFHQSLQHALSGLRIIAEQRLTSSGQLTQPSPPSEILTKAFLILQGQVMELGDPTVFSLYESVPNYQTTIADRVSTVEEALNGCEILSIELFSFLEECGKISKAGADNSEDIAATILPEYKILKGRCDRWSDSVDQLIKCTKVHEHSQNQAHLILKVHQAVMHIFLQSFLNGGVLDSFEDELAEILRLVELFLQPQSVLTVKNTEPGHQWQEASPTFSMSLGVVPILFLLTWRVTLPSIRHKAHRLLRTCNRREGVWDSSVAAHLADQIIALQGRPGVKIMDIAFLPNLGPDFQSARECLIKYVVTSEEHEEGSWLPSAGSEQWECGERVRV